MSTLLTPPSSRSSSRSSSRNSARRQPVVAALEHTEGSRHGLRQVYRRSDLVILGLGVMTGAGIFNLAAVQAAESAGPAVLMSFGVAAAVCLLAALCYAELASTVPAAGSAYTWTYVGFGELLGWLVGWALLLEMLLAVAVVGRAWSLYFAAALGRLDVELPTAVAERVGLVEGFDLGLLLILVLVVLVVAFGGRLGVRALWALVLAKLAVISAVILVGFPHVRPNNLTPFVPPSQPGTLGGDRTLLEALLGQAPQNFGLIGIFGAAAVIAFAYIGFDIVATGAEETRRPRENIGPGIVTGLLIVTGLYIGVAFVLVGMRPFRQYAGSSTPVADAFNAVDVPWMGTLAAVGAVIALTTVVLVALMGASRVAYAMARDGLLPSGMAKISPRFRTPFNTTMVLGLAAFAAGEWTNILDFEQLLVIAAVFTFVFVCLGVLQLRRTQPDLARGFRVPLYPVVPVLGVLASLWLMLGIRVEIWLWFLAWLGIGLLIYFIFGQRNSRISRLIGAQLEQEQVRATRDLRHRGQVRL